MSTVFDGSQGGTDGATKPDEKKDNLLDALVGEGKKYKTVEELAKAYVNADTFIDELKNENRGLREKVTKDATLAEALQRLQQQENEGRTTTTAAPAITEETLLKLVDQAVTGRETVKTKEANLLKADKRMKELFGEKAVEVFKSKATTPETAKALTALAEVNPEQFIALFEQPATSTSTVDTGTTNTTSLGMNKNTESTEGTMAYYNKIRRENPELYYSQDFQIKMDMQVRKNPALYFGQ